MNHFDPYTDLIGQNTDHAILLGSIFGPPAFEGYWLSCTACRPTLLVGIDPTGSPLHFSRRFHDHISVAHDGLATGSLRLSNKNWPEEVYEKRAEDGSGDPGPTPSLYCGKRVQARLPGASGHSSDPASVSPWAP